MTNGWDHISRQKSTIRFSLDYEEMERRHKPLFKKFEKGKVTLDEYLNQVVFFKKRNFSRQDFKDFMFAQSRPFNSTLQILGKLAAEKKYRIATLNNESLELNNYRIDKFGLAEYFECFFTSCYMGVRKPEPEMFDKVLHILHNDPQECLYIDDREENYQAANSHGINAVLLDDPENLAERLREYNIKI